MKIILKIGKRSNWKNQLPEALAPFDAIFPYRELQSSSIFNEILLIVSLNFAERYLKYRYIHKLGRNTCVFVSYFYHYQSKLRLEGSLCSLSLD